MDKEKLSVIYEDNHLIVVIKPHNIPTQEDSSGDMDMLTMVKEYIREKYNKQGNVFAGLVHRLDRPTGGVMVFAKTSKAAARLCDQIREGLFEKRYLAVVLGAPKEKRAVLTHYLLKDEQKNIVRVVPLSTENAKRSELEYRVLEERDRVSLLDINLITGRSHQARVQLAQIGCPIFGDSKYGGDRLAKGYNLCLWAYSLRFEHPTTKEIMVFKVFPETEKTPWKYFAIAKHVSVARPE